METMEHEGLVGGTEGRTAGPRNRGPIENFNGHARITGPCGDTMEFWLRVENGIVAKASFDTDGCGPSLACGSMAATLAEGRRLEDAAAMSQREILGAFAEFPSEFEHCALLASNTLAAACGDYGHRRQGEGPHPGGVQGASKTCGGAERPPSNGGKGEDDDAEGNRRLQSRMDRIRHRVIVLSGKGGVGKSTVAVNLAAALAQSGRRVGLLDIDIHGPSIPTMLGLEREEPRWSDEGLLPIDLGGMKVMSLGLLLPHPDDAVVWRGPRKTGVIRQFLGDVVWGDLDYLIIDAPPGTGDEPLSVCQLAGRMDGAVVVTTPQKVAAVDVRKSITFCRRLEVPVLGVVENMSGFCCPACGTTTPILRSGGGSTIAAEMGVPFLGSIPIDPNIAESCDSGRSYLFSHADLPAAAVMREAVRLVEGAISERLAPRREREEE